MLVGSLLQPSVCRFFKVPPQVPKKGELGGARLLIRLMEPIFPSPCLSRANGPTFISLTSTGLFLLSQVDDEPYLWSGERRENVVDSTK